MTEFREMDPTHAWKYPDSVVFHIFKNILVVHAYTYTLQAFIRSL